jgi:hypothetical protein
MDLVRKPAFTYAQIAPQNRPGIKEQSRGVIKEYHPWLQSSAGILLVSLTRLEQIGSQLGFKFVD